MIKRRIGLALGGIALGALAVGATFHGGSRRLPERTITYSCTSSSSTHPIDPRIPLWPGDPHVVFKTVATFKKDGYYLRSFTIGEHSATHMNAPNSFIAGNRKAITSYPASQPVVHAVVIDIRSKAAANADYRVTKADVLAWEAKHGKIEPGNFVILFTGWESRWSSPKRFINQDAKGNLHFPGFAGATTRWLLAERRISGVGTDTHGVDAGLDTAYATNTAIAKAHRIAIECMANLDKLPTDRCDARAGAVAVAERLRKPDEHPRVRSVGV